MTTLRTTVAGRRHRSSRRDSDARDDGTPDLIRCLGAIVLGTLISGLPVPATAAELAPSSYIADVQIDIGTLHRYADESDNYHLTWHADGALYGAYGDGWGFVRTNVSKRAIGVSRITGSPPNLGGVDVWEGDAFGQTCCWRPWNGKSWGMIPTGAKRLYMWFTIGRPREFGFTEARIASSADGGRSWAKAGWAFTRADGLLMPSFLQVGKAYTSSELPAEIMDYVYSYHARLVAHPGEVQTPGRIDLIRVRKDQIKNRGAYEFFAGADGTGAAIWSKDLKQRVPVLEKPHVLDAPPTVAWNPYLHRFIMAMGHVPAADTAGRGVGFYEARQLWGPWYRIKELDEFAEGTIFFFQFPTKWMSADLSAWLAFTGPDKPGGQEWDALNVAKARFVLVDGPT